LGLARAVGLVIEKPEQVEALLRHPNQRSGLLAETGDLLFDGDQLIAFGTGVRYLTCSTSGTGTVLELLPGSSMRTKVIGSIPCRLPRVSNPIPASYQDGGDRVDSGRNPPKRADWNAALNPSMKSSVLWSVKSSIKSKNCCSGRLIPWWHWSRERLCWMKNNSIQRQYAHMRPSPTALAIAPRG
jgi:hypothetical protein